MILSLFYLIILLSTRHISAIVLVNLKSLGYVTREEGLMPIC